MKSDTLRAEETPRSRVAATLTAAISATLIVVLIGASIWFLFARDELASERFDQKRWFVGKSDSECGRGRMAKDLQERLLRDGSTKQALQELLGPPDEVLSAQTQYVYELGYCNGTDQYRLHAYFSPEGQMQNVEVK